VGTVFLNIIAITYVVEIINLLFMCAVCYVAIRSALLLSNDRNHPKIPGAREVSSALGAHKYYAPPYKRSSPEIIAHLAVTLSSKNLGGAE
jgi:hypothetical protein